MRYLIFIGLMLCTVMIHAQTAQIKGILQDSEGEAVPYANVMLYTISDSTLTKAETSDENGVFRLSGLKEGEYFLKATFVGLADLRVENISLKQGDVLEMDVLSFEPAGVELAEATVTARRAIIEVKPDRTVFNVDGTINSVGSDALSLLRKAPGVTVDNNDNINVLGRSGLLIYVDGKRLPLSGDDLSNYLQNLQADQIDRIDIITNPGARYEAEGNAGIIDIKLKKDKNLGANGSVSGTYSRGQMSRGNFNANGNYRNKWLNSFVTAGYNQGMSFWNMVFESRQNGLFLDEINNRDNDFSGHNVRWGTDFFVAENHTVGFLVSRNFNNNDRDAFNRIEIGPGSDITQIDSILVATNMAEDQRDQQTYNINYRYDNQDGRILNVDLDYGRYENDSERYQPNQYFDANEEVLLTEVINAFDTPTEIDIYTFKVDFEEKIWGGKLGLGSKISQVISDNTFLFYDVINGDRQLNEKSSNLFKYDERVYAGYLTFSRPLGEKWNFSAGLRAEQTDATGDLKAFLPELQEPPVELNYLSWFPSAGITWNVNRSNTLSLNYGRRINRPDYNVLNPFNNQISELSFQKGNPFLSPEIVNNIELGYTLKYRYNFKIGYSRTTDQITRLIAPDDEDPRAGFLTWENLSEQTIFSFNVSAPVEVTDWWNAFFNANASHLDNQADYGDGAIVDLQAFTYSIYSQHTFELPFGFTGEVSGYYSGPGVWGGVFEYESNWSLDLGLQKKFLNDNMNVRVSVSDLFYETGWDGVSSFDGLVSRGSGRWDSRRGTLSVSYRFGNQNVKSRKRKTGLEDEKSRIGQGD